MGVTYEQVRDWVLDLPGGREVEVPAWGRLTLRAGEKMVAIGDHDAPSLSLKASKEDQAALIAASPEIYRIAPYTGRHGWVQVDLSTVDAEELRELVVEAWRLTAPKRAVRAFDAEA